MAKKKVVKKSNIQKILPRITQKKLEEAMESQVNKILVENFVSLQKVMVNLSTKFEGLASQISKLLELFEVSAKTIAEKDFEADKASKENKKILEKIDSILEQNKTIARGMTLMNEKIDEALSKVEAEQSPPIFEKPIERQIRTLPPLNLSKQMLRSEPEEGYQKSINPKTQGTQ